MAKTKAKTKQVEDFWQNRITQYGEQPADQFLPHELNARRHPGNQRDALRGSLNAVGWVAPVIVSARSGKILDGHARVEEALSKDEHGLVPFVEVDVSENEERTILATFDPITGLATYEREALDALLREVDTGDAALQAMLSELAAKEGVILPDLADAFDGLPSEDRAPFQQMTFTVTDSQAEEVKRALTAVIANEDLTETGNENSNGNALAFLAERYLDGRS
jgi:hypothetical protein